MAANHHVRGVWKNALAAGVMSYARLGDSINDQYQSWSMVGTACTRYPVACAGGCVGILNSSGAGWPMTCSAEWAGATYTNRALRRPGDAWSDASSKHALRRTFDAGSLPDAVSFGSPLQFSILPTAPYEQNWDTGHTARVTVVARTTTSPRGPAQWNVQCWDRSNASMGGEFTTTNLNQAAAIRSWTTPGHARGSGVFNTFARINSWNEVETGWVAQYLSLGVKLTTKTTGIFWGFIGNGSWTTKNHSSASGQVITVDAPTYTGAYSDAALQAEISAYGYNVYGIWLGQNNANDEWNGTTIGNYSTNVQNIITRIRAAHTALSLAAPKFVLYSPYDTETPNTRFTLMAAALRAISVADPAIDYVDVRGIVEDLYGAQSTHAAQNVPSTGGSDPIHPGNAAFRNAVTDAIYTALNNPNVSSGLSIYRVIPACGIGLVGD